MIHLKKEERDIVEKLSERLNIQDKTLIQQAMQGFKELIQEETELIHIREEPGRIVWETERNPKKECEALLAMSEQGEVKGILFPSHSVVYFIHYNKKESMFELLPEYKEELKREKYCKAFLQYVATKRPEWLEEMVTILEPLTQQQRKVWKQVRLQSLMK